MAENEDKSVDDVTPEEVNAPEDSTQGQSSEESTPHVVQHLDVDPNDPRNAKPAGKLPSLDDEGQS